MEKIKVLFNEEDIKNRIQEIAKELNKKYQNEEVTFICTLKGAIFFFCDLVKEFKGDARIEFLRVSSYEGESSTGKINLKLPLKAESIHGKNVVLVEDIVDTGYTLKYIRNYVKEMNPKSYTDISLLDKKARRKVEIDPDYSGFIIDDLFVIGYGLDYDQKYRNLPYIGVVEK